MIQLGSILRLKLPRAALMHGILSCYFEDTISIKKIVNKRNYRVISASLVTDQPDNPHGSIDLASHRIFQSLAGSSICKVI